MRAILFFLFLTVMSIVPVFADEGDAKDANTRYHDAYVKEVVEGKTADAAKVYLALGMVETEFDQFVDAGQDFSGNEFPFAPSWSVTLGANWRFAERWVADAQVTSQDSFYSEPGNLAAFEVDGRTLVNAKVGYRWDRWGVSLFARNLLDEDYLLERLAAGSRSGEPQVFGLEWSFGL